MSDDNRELVQPETQVVRQEEDNLPLTKEVTEKISKRIGLPGMVDRQYQLLYGKEGRTTREHVESLVVSAKREKLFNVDSITGLEILEPMENEIKERLSRSINRIDDVFAQTGNIQETTRTIAQSLTMEARIRLIQDIQDIQDIQATSQEDKNTMVLDALRKHNFVSEMSRLGYGAGDFQGLKNCNDVGATQLPDMNGEGYVNKFGFQEYGRKMQALSILLDSDEYVKSLDVLNGTTIQDPFNNFQEVQVSAQYYMDVVSSMCEQAGVSDNVNYLKNKKIKIIPIREGKRGDEVGFLITKDGSDENGVPEPLTNEDFRILKSVIDATSPTEVAKYGATEDQVREAATRTFQDRDEVHNLQELRASFMPRLGMITASHVIENSRVTYNQATEPTQEEFVEGLELVIIRQAQVQMESNKDTETLYLMHRAVNRDPIAQLRITELIIQGRFPGDVGTFTKAIGDLQANGFQDATLDYQQFNELIVEPMDRRKNPRK